MIKHNQVGAVSGVGIGLALAIVLLIGAVAFGGWAYTSRQDYKNNTDQKIAAAVTVAKQQESSVKDAEFAQQEKYPLRTYSGPDAYGSLSVVFPKTWSGMVDDTGTGQALVDGFFSPNTVPSTTSQNSTFALRVQVLGQAYADVLQTLQAQQQNTQNPLSISPYALPKVPSVVGVKATGALPNQKTGIMVVLPLRDKTLEIWTEGSQFSGDFNNIILPNFSFAP